MAHETNKIQFYSSPDLVKNYDFNRFAGAGGQYVHHREVDAVLQHLPPAPARVLDAPCGTGRHMLSCTQSGYSVVGVDSSPAMLASARERVPLATVVQAVLGQALPFDSESFDAVVSWRFFFHYPDGQPFIKEFARVLKPGGRLILDTYRWSPLQYRWAPRFLGGRLFTHSVATIATWCLAEKLKLRACSSAFIFPPTIYRFLPSPMMTMAKWVEQRVPPGMLLARFLCFERQ